jgi:RND superfamily putative drug exporter
MSAAFGAIARFAVRFRWFMLIGWLIATFAAVSFLPSLGSVAQDDNTSFLSTAQPSVHAGQLAAPFGAFNRSSVTVVVARTSGRLTAANAATIDTLQDRLRAAPGVEQVRDFGRSADGRAEQLAVSPRPKQNASDLVTDLRTRIAQAGLPAGIQAHLAGQAATQLDNKSQGSSARKIENFSSLFVVVLLMLVFRSMLAPLMALMPAVLAVTIAGPLAAEATHAGLKVSSLAQTMMIVLIIGAGTDYGLFLMFRTREELRDGSPPKQAVVRALTRVGESITFSAGIVIAAMLSLLAATFSFYSDLAIPLAIGIGVMLLAGLTLLPALLAIFGLATFWPSDPTTGTSRIALWGRISGRIVRHPVATLVIGLAVFVPLAIAASGYTASGAGVTADAPPGSDSAVGNSLLAKYFPKSAANPLNFVVKLPAPAWEQVPQLSIATERLSASPLFTGVIGPLNPGGVPLTASGYAELHTRLGPARALPPTPPPGSTVPLAQYEAYRATANYVSGDGHSVQFAVRLAAGDAGSTDAMHAVPDIRTETTAVARSIGAVDWGVSGQAPALYDVDKVASSDLSRVIPIAVVVIGLLLGLVMRSLVAPLYLIASVVLSYFAAFGLAVLVFIKIGGADGLTFFLPFLMFVFLLALGEDYNILVMTRIREEAQRLPLPDAVSRALNTTGTTVTSAGLVLAGTFAVFGLLGSRGPNGAATAAIGLGLAIGVLLDTFLVRTLLVPSIVVLFGRWNWWPSRVSRVPAPSAGAAVAEESESLPSDALANRAGGN